MAFVRIFLRILFALSLLLVSIALANDSEEGVIPWPNKTVRVFDQTGRGQSMRAAIKIWNSTGINFTIRLVDDPDRADIVAEAADHFSLNCNHPSVVGCASIGKQPALPWQKPIFQLKRPLPGEGRQMIFTSVAAHEFGHILGLDHNRLSCSLMNSKSFCHDRTVGYSFASDCPVLLEGVVLHADQWCPGRSKASILCGPSLQEVKMLIQRYGGRLNKKYSPYCHSSVKQKWIGWCLYPDWLPSGYRRPWFVKNKCSANTPAKYLAPLFIAIEKAAAQRQQLRQGLRESSNAFDRANNHQLYRAITRVENRWRSLVPRKMRGLLY